MVNFKNSLKQNFENFENFKNFENLITQKLDMSANCQWWLCWPIASLRLQELPK